MLHLLTNYLLQYKTVSIPHVGTIQIVHHSATIDVVNKMIEPPRFVAELKMREEVSEHQLHYLAQHLDKGKDAVAHDLNFFGDELHDKVNGPGFEWRGLGMITRSTQTIPIRLNSLQSLAAAKVIRADARHSVLVGDRQISGSSSLAQSNDTIEIIEKRTPVLIVIAWIVLLLSILAIAFILYLGKFKVNASGSKLNTTTSYHLVTPKNHKA